MKTFVVLVCLASLSMVLGQPGLKAIINPAGINFALDLIEESPVEFPLNGFSTPREVLNGLSVQTIAISDLSIIDFDFGTVSLAQLNETTFRFSGEGSVSEFFGKFSISYESAIPGLVLFEDEEGDVHFQYNGSSSIEVDLTVEEEGAVVSILGCNVGVVPESAKFLNRSMFPGDNSRADLDEILKSSDMINHITTQMCSDLATAIAANLTLVIGDIPSQVPVTPTVMINTTIYSLPALVANRSLETKVDGRSFPTHNPDVDFGYTRPILPEFEVSSRMAQIAVSDFSIRTLIHSFIAANVTRFEVNSTQVQLGQISFNVPLLSLIVPDIVNFLDGRDLFFGIVIDQAPSIDLSPSLITIAGDIELSLIAVDASDGTKELVTALIASVSSSFNVSIENHRISAHISTLTLSIAEKNSPSPVGTVNVGFLNFFFSPASINTILLPAINTVLANGFELPPILGYNLQNSEVEIVDRAIYLSFDLVGFNSLTTDTDEVDLSGIEGIFGGILTNGGGVQ